MNFTDIFIRRPVFATVLSLIILLIGARAYFSLSTRLYPKVDASVVMVTVTYAGADAELMEGFVATPIENAIAGVDGIDYMTSSSIPGQTTISIYFNLGYDINVAMTDVSSKVSSVRYQLPKDIDDPVVNKKDPNAIPTLYISYFSNVLSPEEITDYLERVVQPQLQTLPGIAQALIYGEREYAMRIWLDPKLMAAHDVATSDIKQALTLNNLQAPGGPLKSESQQMNVKTYTELASSAEFDDMVIKDVNGHLIRIKDVGRAELGAKNTDFSVLSDGIPAATLAIIPSPTANPLDVANEVKAIFPQLERSMPKGMESKLIWDNSIYIKQSIEEVKKTIIQASLCVIAVVFVFICSWRMLLIPLVTIPLSLIGVFGIMLALGYSLNTITFLSLVLAIGMVVDDAIVVSENVHRHISMGKKPFEAALFGAREIQFAVISMTFTLAAVYAPMGFLTGLIGSLFKEFAFTLASAVIISGFIALTLSPMMCSKFMTADVMEGKLAKASHHYFDKIMHAYRGALETVLQHRKIVVACMLAIFLSSGILYKLIPAELAPREDIGGVMVVVTAPTSAGLAYTEKYTKYLTPIFKGVAEASDYLVVNGANGVNTAISFLVFKPWSERKRTADQIIKEIYPKLWAIPGITAFPVSPSMLPGTSGAMPISVVIESIGEYSELNEVMKKLLAAAHANPGLTNIDTDLKMDQAQIDVKIDRNKAGDMGIKISDIGDAVNIALGEPTINYFSILGRSYDVIPQLEAQYRKQPETLNLLYLHASNGDLVPLSNLVNMKETLQPQSLNHFQQLRSATLTASMRPGYTLGQALTYLQKQMAKIVPDTMQINYSAESRQFMQTSGAMESTLLFAIAFIFLVLAAQFESFRDPLVVLFSVPLSFFGALLALKLSGGTSNIYSQIGIVTLVGLISKHGILMVEFANQLQEQGKSIHEAIVESATIRLRPILMTTGAMVLGAIPLALATGAGAISRRDIGWVIVGGMTVGTIFTLFVVPTMYTLLATKKKVEVAHEELSTPPSLPEAHT